MIAKNRKDMGGDRSGGDVKHCRQQFTRELEHVRDHQQQTLRARERRAHRARLQHAMDCARCAALALHLNDGRGGSPEIFCLRTPIDRTIPRWAMTG